MRRLPVLVAGLVLLGGPAVADCRGPALLPPDVVPVVGGPLQVRGEAFLPCDDVGTGVGCGPGPRGGLDDVELVLEQGPRRVVLDVADADDDGLVRFRGRLPDDLAPGPAVLRASGGELAITLAARR